MPKTTLTYSSLESIPTGLQAFATKVSDTQFTVEVFYGGEETVAKETNPALEKNRNEILQAKDKYKKDYQTQLDANVALARSKSELEIKLATGLTVTPEEKQIIDQVKTLGKVEDIQSAVTDFTAIKTERDKLIAEKNNSTIFKATGFKDEKVFLDLISNPAKMSGVTKTFVETIDGKDTVYVMVKDEATNTESKKTFDDYYKNNAEWKPYIPVLTQGQESGWFAQQPTGGGNAIGNNQGNQLLSTIITAQNKSAKVETK